jgi:hypothetical protein
VHRRAASPARARSAAGRCFGGTVPSRWVMTSASAAPASSSAATKFLSFSRKPSLIGFPWLPQDQCVSGIAGSSKIGEPCALAYISVGRPR